MSLQNGWIFPVIDTAEIRLRHVVLHARIDFVDSTGWIYMFEVGSRAHAERIDLFPYGQDFPVCVELFFGEVCEIVGLFIVIFLIQIQFLLWIGIDLIRRLLFHFFRWNVGLRLVLRHVQIAGGACCIVWDIWGWFFSAEIGRLILLDFILLILQIHLKIGRNVWHLRCL